MFFFFLTGVIIILKKNLQKKNGITAANSNCINMKRKIANPNFQKSWTLSPKPCGFLQLIHKINYKIIKSTPSAMKSILMSPFSWIWFIKCISKKHVEAWCRFHQSRKCYSLDLTCRKQRSRDKWEMTIRFCFSFDFLLLSNCGRVDWGSWCRRRVHMENDVPHSPVVNLSLSAHLLGLVILQLFLLYSIR